jgi:hypothetical protein
MSNAPCNGWMAWYYIDAGTGNRVPINNLRKRMREESKIDTMIKTDPGNKK